MKKELKFILNTLQNIKTEDTDNFNWYWISGFLDLHKISVPFYNCAKDLNLPLPQQIERRLFNTKNQQSERNETMRKWIEDISSEIRYEDIRYAFLKGSVISNTDFKAYYSNEISFQCMAKYNDFNSINPIYASGERISNDIDILISPLDIQKADRALKRLGFKQAYWDFKTNTMIGFSRAEIISRRMNRGETVPYMQVVDNTCRFIEVDINFSVDYLPNGKEIILQDMLSDTVIYNAKLQTGINSMKPEKFLLHLILHLYKEAYVYSMVKRGKDLELYKYLDIYKFINNKLINYDILLELIRKYNIYKECYYVLYNLSEIFNIKSDLYKLFPYLKPTDDENINTVIDPENKNRKYKWNITLFDRLEKYHCLNYLVEDKGNE